MSVKFPRLKASYSLSRVDAVEWLEGLPAVSVDLLITDPPYESLEKHRAVGTTTRLKKSKASSNEWFRIFPNDRLASFFQAAFRVMAKNSHLYMFCDPDTLWHAVPAGEAAGFRFWKPIVWDKLTLGMGYHYRRQYEFILFFEKGKRRLQDLGVSDVLRAKRVHRGYPTEKPVEILRTLVTQSASPGELVCDPFFGSGSTGEAAILEGCRFVGTDINGEAVVAARQRLDGIDARLSNDGRVPSRPEFTPHQQRRPKTPPPLGQTGTSGHRRPPVPGTPWRQALQ